MYPTRNTLLATLLVCALALMGVSKASAAVTVTGATGGSAISADTTGNAWTTLGAITIAEGANGDFAAGTSVTLVLNAPAGFEFNTAVIPDVSFTAGNDISSADCGHDGCDDPHPHPHCLRHRCRRLADAGKHHGTASATHRGFAPGERQTHLPPQHRRRNRHHCRDHCQRGWFQRL